MEEPCVLPAVCRERSKHCAERLDDTRTLFLRQMEAMDKAVEAAKAEMDRRLEGMNEFRSQLEKQADTFLERGYYDLQHKNLTDKLDILTTWKNIQDGKSSWTNLIAIGSFLVAVVAVVVHFVR